MRIGIVAPAHNPLPYPANRSWAPGVLISTLTKELSNLGHEVFLFATDDSKIPNYKIKKISTGLNSIYHDFPTLREDDFAKFTEVFSMYDIAVISKAIKYAQNNRIDILHFHDIRRPLFFKEISDQKTLFTYHAPLDPHYINWIKNAQQSFGKKIYLSVLSRSHFAEFEPYFKNIKIIENGIDISHFRFNNYCGDEFIFVGRFIESKGVEIALRVAQETGISLSLHGYPGDTKKDQEYFLNLKNRYKDLANIKFKGYIDYQNMPEIYANARAEIFPLIGKEAFGMTMVESMACGTPVVAFDREAVKEIINDEKTGFVAKKDDFEDLKAKVLQIKNMPREEYLTMRKNARERVEANFSTKIMAKKFEKYYLEIVNKEN